MRVGDIVETLTVPTVMQLDTVLQLRERLDVDLLERGSAEYAPPTTTAAGSAPPSEPPSGPTAEVRRILRDYVLCEPDGAGGGENGDGSPAVALRTALEGMSAPADGGAPGPAGGGAGFLIDGVHGSGKTHFLSVLSLLLEYQAARDIFAGAHPEFGEVLARLGAEQPLLVVLIPLDEHRGRNELLEDIVFDTTETEFARPKYGIHLPLSAQSHALHLIDEYVAPRYRHELDAYIRRDSGGPDRNGSANARPSDDQAQRQATLAFGDGEWARLRRRDPRAALQVARQFLSEMNYPLDFRQSRVQRLRSLTEALQSNGFRGIVWLVDELGLFLRSAEPKALANDCGFLQFLGQSTQTHSMWFVGTMRRSMDAMTDLSPHAILQVRERYKTGLSLAASNVRQVLRRRVLRRPDPDAFSRAMLRLHDGYKQRFPQLSFTQAQLAAAYPLHPMTMDCLEAAAGRFLSRARSAIDFVQARVAGDRTRALAGILDHDVAALVTPDVLFDHFAGQMAQSAGPLGEYVGEVHEYFVRNIATLLPGQAGLGMRTVKTLLMLRATNQEASVKRLAECVMLLEPAADECPHAAMHAVLQQLSDATPYVRVRKREHDAEDVYFIEVPPRADGGIRHRVAMAKSVLADDDPRIVEHVLRACCTAIFPINNFRQPKVVELEWRNTRRHATAVQVNISALSTAQLGDGMNRLADPETRESCQVFIGVPFRTDEQVRHWQSVCRDLPTSRWRSALIAWIPRRLAPGELLRLKEYAAASMVDEVGATRRLSRTTEPLPRAHEGDAAPANSRDIEALMREIYAEGTLVTAAAAPPKAAPSPSLPAIKDDWGTLLRYVCGVAFEGVFPRFTDVMPTARLASRQQIDRLIAGLILGDLTPESMPPRLRALVRTHLGPMKLVTERDGRFVLSASDSAVAAEAFDFISHRDTSKRHARGRPMAFEHLLQLMAKSEFGVPQAMSRVVVSVLARLGYLEMLDEARQPIQLCARRRPTPGGESDADRPSAPTGRGALSSVAYVARAPLLAHHEWQQAGRIARGLLGVPLAPPDWPVQQALWEQLVAAKAEWDERLSQLRRGLDDLCRALEHRREQWRESHEAIEAASAVFECIDPSRHAADGLTRLIAGCGELCGRSRPLGDRPLAPAVAQIVAHIDAIGKFLADNAKPLIQIHEYLSRVELPAKPAMQATAHRERLLQLINGGEALVGSATMAARLWRSFQTAYIREYVAWHEGSHRAPEFQRYRQLRSMPAYRALQQLSKLALSVQLSLKDVDAMLDVQLAKQCSNEALSDDLKGEPLCPKCQLHLGASLDLVPAKEVDELIHRALAEHIAALKQPPVRKALIKYAESCPTTELGNRVRALTELSLEVAAARLLADLSNDLIRHARRAIAGRRIHLRRLEALRGQSAGRTLTKGELAETLRKWLDERDELAADELIRVE